MDPRLRDSVRLRARGRCEYCGFPEVFTQRAFHCDHVLAQQHGGKTVFENLAWSCNRCNLHKGPNLSSIDPDSREAVRLFNPRADRWDEHFHWRGALLVGHTPVGRATVSLLGANDPMVIATRAALMEEGAYDDAI
jgi:HNH endonuclease